MPSLIQQESQSPPRNNLTHINMPSPRRSPRLKGATYSNQLHDQSPIEELASEWDGTFVESMGVLLDMDRLQSTTEEEENERFPNAVPYPEGAHVQLPQRETLCKCKYLEMLIFLGNRIIYMIIICLKIKT